MLKYDKKIKQKLQELRPEIESWLKSSVSEARFNHIIRVAKAAKKYAKKLGLDHYKAELSGLLHDCAKEYPPAKLLEIAQKSNLKLDSIDHETPHILHARVGAIIAKEKFGIDNSDILGGIRCHTLGESQMSELTMVVYLADASEPGRKKKEAAKLRKIFKSKGLNAAVLEGINYKISDTLEHNKKIHPLTIEARNWLLEKIKIQDLSSNH